jgi:hypothetical protein
MKPFVRQQFICSAIEQCTEKANCCAHKTPHIKDERCVPKECRYAPAGVNVDCDPYDPENPRAPIPVPVAPVKTVEQVMREKYVIAEPVKAEPVKEEPAIVFVEPETVAIPEEVTLVLENEATQEINIKEAVKKQATSKKKGRK